MPELALTIVDLASSASWRRIKGTGKVAVQHGSNVIEIDLVRAAQPSGLLSFACSAPGCSHRSKALYRSDNGELVCASCAGLVRDQIPGSAFGRMVVRPARQIVKINQQLERRHLERNHRRRLRRRRAKLMQQIEATLTERIDSLQSDLDKLIDPMFPSGLVAPKNARCAG